MTNTKDTTLFQRLGGKAAVEALVRDFYERLLADDSLAPFFADRDLDQLRRHQAAFLGAALGGPSEYRGRAMREAHRGMGIGNDDFAAVAGHLEASLSAAGVGPADITTILETVGGLREDVVGV